MPGARSVVPRDTESARSPWYRGFAGHQADVSNHVVAVPECGPFASALTSFSIVLSIVGSVSTGAICCQVVLLAIERFATLTRHMRKESTAKAAVLNIRGVPRELLHRFKLAAVTERKSVKGLLMELMQGKVQDLERKGLLAKGK